MSSTTTAAAIISGDPLPVLPPIDDPEQDKFNRDLVSYLRRLAGRFTTEILSADEALRIDDLNGFIESPLVKNYTLTEYVEFKLQLVRITHKLLTGDCSILIKVDGVPLAGVGDLTPSIVQGVYTFDDNTVAVGQRVELEVTVVGSGGAIGDLNTRSKRASSVGILLPFVLAPPLPDGLIDAADRQHIADTYSGILAGSAAEDLAFTLKRERLND